MSVLYYNQTARDPNVRRVMQEVMRFKQYLHAYKIGVNVVLSWTTQQRLRIRPAEGDAQQLHSLCVFFFFYLMFIS